MQLRQFTLGFAVLTAIASVLSAGSAHAISFNVTKGVANPWTGATNQGAYSEYATLKDTVTVDFNNGKVPTSGFAKYSFTKADGSTRVLADMWAPVGPNGEKNTSTYLETYAGSNVVIDLASNLNYFGINWGAAHTGNIYSFYNGNNLIRSFTTADIDKAGGFATYSALHPGSNEAGAQQQANGKYYQGNGYVHFYSEGKDDIFNRIVISQSGGGGFETDNHSFHKGNDRFKDVPEPTMTLGLLAVGGGWLLRRRQSRTA
ncbi:PEP-CTERM sorting domain-containing protein [Phormidium tenue FACHB-886]|nr:PEP-CTERM sorting domain-containing protein [Phormidium tenue FACHB-886]